jgi:hypothetical protein
LLPSAWFAYSEILKLEIHVDVYGVYQASGLIHDPVLTQVLAFVRPSRPASHFEPILFCKLNLVSELQLRNAGSGMNELIRARMIPCSGPPRFFYREVIRPTTKLDRISIGSRAGPALPALPGAR